MIEENLPRAIKYTILIDEGSAKYISDIEIEEILLMPKVGKKISLAQALNLRYVECTTDLNEKGGFNMRVYGLSLASWARNREYYIEIKDSEMALNGVSA